ncbi:MAG: type II restriction endonuclease subunit M [Burkholderiaceae bacterium]|nr:type II restriction endonuclease subunit M [Burkholderiaceae bacterium]
MTHFLRLLAESDKATALSNACTQFKQGASGAYHFDIPPSSFDPIPGKPFAYWVSDAVRQTFERLSPFESDERVVRVGLQTSDDFRFVRASWEVTSDSTERKWRPFAKGGAYSPFYSDIHLCANWKANGLEIDAFPASVVRNADFYFRPGLTWPLRAHRFAPQALPAGSIFSVRGYCAFPERGHESATLALFNSRAFDYLFKTALGRYGYPEFIVGILQIMPWAKPQGGDLEQLGKLARRAWSLKRTLDTSEETSHAFLLPEELLLRVDAYDPKAIEAELAAIASEIDRIAFDLYAFGPDDRVAVMQAADVRDDDDDGSTDHLDEDDAAAPVAEGDALLSWAVGVAFGRFDWRLATGERAAPPEPEPFDPLPAKSPGMLADDATPFHMHAGILVDDVGHQHDLAHLIEEVFVRVKLPAPDDARRWLQREFFPFHLQHYSKSRRKAPIYWPLATTSGSYTLWLYYPSLSNQTLYTAINDFVEPKLKQVGDDIAALRIKGSARTRDDEKQFESLQHLETELLELRDKLQELASSYKPNHDDGVQITSARLWPLFRHMPWQKVLKDTWARLEKGDYDWAHLAMAYWPDRVREKCKTDKSLAIAHGLEGLYVEREAAPKKTRGRKKTADAE